MRYDQLIQPSRKMEIINRCVKCGHGWRSKVFTYDYCAKCRKTESASDRVSSNTKRDVEHYWEIYK